MATEDHQNQTSVSSSPRSLGDAPTISIRLHSPSSEVPNPFTLTFIPVATTVRELKSRIRDALPSKPELDRQRLIHRGRMLGNENETMVHVFGQAALDDSATQSLHLVLRPVATASTSSLAQTEPVPGLFGQVPHERPASVPPIAPPRPHGLHGAAHLHHHHHQQHQALHNNLPHLLHPTIPHPVRGFINDHLAAMNQHMAQPFHQPGGFPTFPPLNPDRPTHLPPATTAGVPRTTTTPPQTRTFQHHVGQNQRARAAAGMHGIHNNSIDGNDQGQTETLNTHPRAVLGAGNPSAFPGISSSYTREGQGPNGQRWQVTVNESTVAVPLFPNIAEPSASSNPQMASNLGGPNDIRPSTLPGATAGHAATSVQRSEPPADPSSQNHLESFFSTQHEQLRSRSQSVMSRLERMESDVRTGRLPSLNAIRDARSDMAEVVVAESVLRHEYEILVPPRVSGARRSQSRNTHPEALNHQDNRNTVRPARSFDQLRATQSSSSGWRSDYTLTSEQTPTPSTHPPPSTLYLLSSPVGPYGLVATPVGLYTTQPPGQTLHPGIPNGANNILHGPFTGSGVLYAGPGAGHANPYNGGIHPFFAGPPGFAPAFGHNPPLQTAAMQQPRLRSNQNQQPQAPAQAPPQAAVPAAQQEQHHPGQAQLPQAQAQAEQNNQVRDLLRVILPLGGHLWLLIRLIGFVFFFGGGAGWRRTILILIGALMIFITQTGIFAGIQEAIMRPIRRHVEGLLPLVDGHARPNPQRDPAVAAAVAAVPAEGDQRGVDAPPDRGQRAGGGGDATETATAGSARRGEEERQQRGLLMEQLRRIERALLIFTASIVPGVGERHIERRQQAALAARAAAAAVAAVIPAPPAAQEQEQEGQGQDTNGQTQGQEGGSSTSSGSGSDSAESSEQNYHGEESSSGNTHGQAQNEQGEAGAVQPLVEI
ncbi:MAG: hypothetical protein M1816_003958 [Peltula sp. TS41687]|nr:MAG: hypothetical protein M1816_003958 [Peltula sp. TS41687]